MNINNDLWVHIHITIVKLLKFPRIIVYVRICFGKKQTHVKMGYYNQLK